MPKPSGAGLEFDVERGEVFGEDRPQCLDHANLLARPLCP
jgi:hypothetical protein